MTMTRSMTLNDYFEWLLSIVEIGKRGDYFILMDTLFKTDFWVDENIHNDYNRVKDGLALREEYLDDCPEDPCEDFRKECSVLEVLVGLAERCDYIMTDPGDDSNVGDYFFMMLKNLGLDRYDDDNYDSFEVRRTIRIFMERGYQRNGRGGLFPLKKSYPDQRKMELWYQMNSYLDEKYGGRTR